MLTPRFLITKVVLPIAIAVIVTYLLLSQIPLRSIPDALGRLPKTSLLIGFGLYVLFVWTKALRFRELLQINTPAHQLFPVLALHTFWSNLLPMRSGDVSYVYLMKRRENVNGTKSVASLVLASLIDIVLLVALLVATGWINRANFATQLSYTAFLLVPSVMGGALVGLMLVASLFPSACMRLADHCLGTVTRWQFRPINWFAQKLRRVVSELTRLHFDWRFVRVWAYSAVSLMLRFGFQAYLISQMALDLPVVGLLFALAFTSLFNLLPIQSVGNFGTIEAPFAWALMQLGVMQELALVSGFSLHLIILLYCLPLGLWGVIWKRRSHGIED